MLGVSHMVWCHYVKHSCVCFVILFWQHFSTLASLTKQKCEASTELLAMVGETWQVPVGLILKFLPVTYDTETLNRAEYPLRSLLACSGYVYFFFGILVIFIDLRLLKDLVVKISDKSELDVSTSPRSFSGSRKI